MVRALLAFVMVVLCCAGCQGGPQNHNGGSQVSGFVEGRARVVRVDQVLGQAVLQIEGQQVNAFWQTEIAYAGAGVKVDNGPLRPAVGQYREATVRPTKFPAETGDLIAFVGLQVGDEILLRGVTVISH